MTQKIVDALKKLDVKNDNHWTADGLPRLDTVKMLASDQTITRDHVAAAAPGFSRATAETWTPSTEGEAKSTDQQAGSSDQQAAQQESQGGSTGSTENAAPAAAQPPAETPSSTEPAVNAADQSGQQTEQSPVAQPAPASSDEVEALEKALAAQSEKVEELRQVRAKLEAEFVTERQKEDDLRAKLEAVRPVKDDTPNAIQEYLASQRRQLEERAAKKQLLKESGLDLKELQRGLRSPLDAAMARKTQRGTQRPGS